MIANIQHWTELIAKKLSGNIRNDEDRMLEAWIARDPEHQEYFEQLSRVWSVTHATPLMSQPEADMADLERRIEGHGNVFSLSELKAPKISLRSIPRRAIGAAAAVLLLVLAGITYVVQSSRVTPPVIAEAVDQNLLEVQLPDGSIVFLRQGSSLTYDRDFQVRSVKIQGEGFFNVTRDEERPFTVFAGSGVIRVLGTKFNVKALNNTPVELFVDEGRVAFSPVDKIYDAKIFSDGQAGMISAQEDAEVERISPPGPNISSWITGKLVFDHEPLDHVIRDLERHFSVEIEVADSALLACELKADFKNASFADILETLAFSLNLQIDTTDRSYKIHGEPCPTVDTENSN
jgi:ferric-dicitrate binding protein FerR (iron transport regulator)